MQVALFGSIVVDQKVRLDFDCRVSPRIHRWYHLNHEPLVEILLGSHLSGACTILVKIHRLHVR